MFDPYRFCRCHFFLGSRRLGWWRFGWFHRLLISGCCCWCGCGWWFFWLLFISCCCRWFLLGWLLRRCASNRWWWCRGRICLFGSRAGSLLPILLHNICLVLGLLCRCCFLLGGWRWCCLALVAFGCKSKRRKGSVLVTTYLDIMSIRTDRCHPKCHDTRTSHHILDVN